MLNYRAIARGFLVDITTTCLLAATLTVVLVDPGSSDFCLAERVSGTNLIDWLCLLGGLAMTGLGAAADSGSFLGRPRGRSISC